MSSVVISGYYGFGNLGDEAVLAGLTSTFRELAPETDLTVLSARPPETEALHGVKAIPRTEPSALLRAIRDSDLFISGGGGLLQDRTSQKSLLYYLGLLFLAQRSRCKTMIMAQGIGPLLRPSSRWLVKKVVEGTNAVTVRDEQSASLLRQIAPKCASIEVTADLAFAMPLPTGSPEVNVAQGFSPAPPPPLRGRGRVGGIDPLTPSPALPHQGGVDKTADLKVCATHNTAEKGRAGMLGVCLRPWPGQERWLPEVSSALNFLSQEDGVHPLFIPLHRPPDQGVINLLLPHRAGTSTNPTEELHNQSINVPHRFPPKRPYMHGGVSENVPRGTFLISPLAETGQVAGNLNHPHQALEAIGQTQVLLGMRLHSLIFAAMMGVPFVALAYDPKVQALAEEAAMPCLPIETATGDQIVATVRSLSAKREEEGNRLLTWANQNRNKARRNVELAVRLLKG